MTSPSPSIPSMSALWEELSRQHYPAATLYVVATPIGNVADISLRAVNVLAFADAVACEDTRMTQHLLTRYGLSKELVAAHEHNEREVAQKLVARLRAGQRIALVSDAGTPAVSDPGARIVDVVRAEGLQVVPIPGACAAVAALSASGLGSDHFYFAGFLPVKARQRETVLAELRALPATLVFYEAPHRIEAMVEALHDMFEPHRQVVFARELTKYFEEIHRCALSEAREWLAAEDKRKKGEYVVLIEGAPAAASGDQAEVDRVLRILLAECPLKQAASLAAQLTGQKKNALYERALQLRDGE